MSDLFLEGKIIDIGGSKKSGYHELISGNHEIVTCNINPEYECDIVFDIEKRFPLESSSFDGALCINVLEHIYEFENVVSETNRVLKKGSKFIVMTPFMHHIHASPSDYIRYTDSALDRLFKKYGFRVEKIEPIGKGLFSLIFQTIGGSIPTSFLRRICKALSVSTDTALCNISRRYKNLASKIPLGYFSVVVKI
jgi:SAM-dependent methyltransferase